MMIKKTIFTLLTILLIFTMIWSCKHDPVEMAGPIDPDPNPIPPGGNPCDPDTVYFEKDLLPILQSTCAQPGCHDAITMQDGVRLTDYNSVMQTADIRPGDPEASKLYERITEPDPEDRMPPPPNNPLSQEIINMVSTWINQGAQNLFCEDSGCDTANVIYSNQVSMIIQTHCFGCHNDNNALAGLSLQGYNNVVAVADDGRLLGVVRHEPGYPPMPKNAGQIPDCKIRQIEIWIENGTPQ